MKRYVGTSQGGYMFVSAHAARVLTSYRELFPKEVFKDDGNIKFALPLNDETQFIISDPKAMEAIMAMGFIPEERLFWDKTSKDLKLISQSIELQKNTLHSLIENAMHGKSKLDPNDVLFVLGLSDILGKEIAQGFVYEGQKSQECRNEAFPRLCECIDEQMNNYYLDVSEYAYIRGKEEKEERKKDGPVLTLVKSAKRTFDQRFPKKNKKD